MLKSISNTSKQNIIIFKLFDGHLVRHLGFLKKNDYAVASPSSPSRHFPVTDSVKKNRSGHLMNRKYSWTHACQSPEQSQQCVNVKAFSRTSSLTLASKKTCKQKVNFIKSLFSRKPGTLSKFGQCQSFGDINYLPKTEFTS